MKLIPILFILTWWTHNEPSSTHTNLQMYIITSLWGFGKYTSDWIDNKLWLSMFIHLFLTLTCISLVSLVGFLTECPRLKWSCPIELRAPHLLQTFLRKTHRFFFSSYSHIFTLGWRMQHPVFGSMVLYKYSERPSGRGGGEGGAMGETFIFCYKWMSLVFRLSGININDRKIVKLWGAICSDPRYSPFSWMVNISTYTFKKQEGATTVLSICLLCCSSIFFWSSKKVSRGNCPIYYTREILDVKRLQRNLASSSWSSSNNCSSKFVWYDLYMVSLQKNT